ncbi:MAG: tRNA lysidine(34) synthetase TilS [Candidatus Cryptobacteroides sp.]
MMSRPDEFRGELLLAVSGGIDSMVLAHIIHSQKQDFSIAHCNFHLRDEDSDGDAGFVSEWARNRGITFHLADFDTVGYARQRNVSIEMAARDLRYGFFARLCREYGYACVVVAHNANDNAETLLLNLVRGTGIRGICGMRECSRMSVQGGGELRIWRPLLNMTRRQIEGYAFSHGVEWREDRTNSSSEYKRNLIRNEVLPLLERLNPSVVRTLNEDMSNFRDAADALPSFVQGTGDMPPGEIRIGFDLTDRNWRYALFCRLEEAGMAPSVIASVLDLAGSGRTVSGKVFHSNGKKAVMTSDGVIVVPETVRTGAEALQVNGPGLYEIGGRKLRVEVFDRPEDFSFARPEGESVLDASLLPFPFVVRQWRHGDWMRPIGARGRKKLSDMFTDLKFNALQKESALVVSADALTSRVLALLGLRVDESVKLSPATVSCLRMKLD